MIIRKVLLAGICWLAVACWWCARLPAAIVVISEQNYLEGSFEGGSYVSFDGSVSGQSGSATLSTSSNSISLWGHATIGGFRGTGAVTVLTVPPVGFKIVYARTSHDFDLSWNGTGPSGSPGLAGIAEITTTNTASFQVHTPSYVPSGHAIISWGEEFLPGETEDDDLPANIYVPPGQGEATTEEGPDVANDTTGAYLTALPVAGSYGFSDFVYLGVGEQTASVDAATPLLFTSDIYFSALRLPSFLGAATYQVKVGDQTQSLAAGEILDFTAIAPQGVRYFFLWPTNPGEALPLATGFQFVAEGPTQVLQGVLIPEPSTFALAAAGAIALMTAKARRGRYDVNPSN